MGTCYWLKKNHDEAIKYYLKAFKLNPQFVRKKPDCGLCHTR